MRALSIAVGHFYGGHKIVSVRRYVQSGTDMRRLVLANGKDKCVRADATWVEGITLHNTLEAGQVRVARRTALETKAGVRERQTSRGEHLTGLASSRRP